MKNKKILYILTIILTLFSFKLSANAAQELTCVYRGSSDINAKFSKIILIQDALGNKKIYSNSNDVGVYGANWYKIDDTTSISTTEGEFNGELSACPKFSSYDRTNEKVIFAEKNNWFQYQKLDKYYDAAIYVESTKTTKPIEGRDPKNEMLVDLDDSKYTGACKYKRMTDNGTTHYIQINFGEKDILITEYDDNKNGYSGEPNIITFVAAEQLTYRFNISENFNIEYFLRNGGDCLDEVYVQRKEKSGYASAAGVGGTRYHEIITTIYKANENKKAKTYLITSADGINPITKKKLSLSSSYGDGIKLEHTEITNCSQLFGAAEGKVSKILNFVWNIIKIGIPILLIALGMIDISTAIFSGKEDGMKKAQGKFVKRIIIAIIIFIVPFLLELLLGIANNIWPSIGTDICGIIF